MNSPPRFYNPDRNQWYVATRLLGQGGQGTVWAGTCNGMPVAIKVQSDFRAWDLEQSIHLKSLGHKFIVTAYDRFRAQDGSLVLVMEQAEGNAQELVNFGTRFTAKQVCRIGADLASALEWLHAAGIRHRDFTLKNVLRFTGGKFKLGDFGIARKGMAADELAMTQVGTPGFFPPEVLKGDGSTPSSDVYQLGLVLLSMLLGRHVIPTNYTKAQMWDAILNALPRQTAEKAIPTHGETARIISKMLPRTPSLRHTSATAVRLAFEVEFKNLNAREVAAATARVFGPTACFTGLGLNPKPPVNNSLAAFSRLIPTPPKNHLAAFAAGVKPTPPRNPLAAFTAGAKPLPPHNALAAIARGVNPTPRRNPLAVNSLAAIARGVNSNPPINRLPGLGAFQDVPRPLVNSLAAIARGVNPNPPVNGLLGLGALQDVPRPPMNGLLAGNTPPAKPNVALGGLLGLGALAALASGQKPLSGLLGLGALAALAGDPNAKSSS